MTTTPTFNDPTIIELIALRERIAECRRQGLWLTVGTLRHEAMSLAEHFVDPDWSMEAYDQRSADRLYISEVTRARCRADALDIDPGLGF